MATALNLIQGSLRLINAYSPGESIDLQIAEDSLGVLNDMIDSWNADRLAIFTTRSDDFPYVLGQQAYTLGTGGNFNIPRPAMIDAMSSIIMTDPSNPIEVPIAMYTVDEWQTEIPVKKVTSTWPEICYDNGDFPLRTLNFWPIPQTQPGNLARIYSWQALSQPAAFNTVIAYPPGYAKAFRFNLAVDLAAEFAYPVPASVQDQATKSLGILKTMNVTPLDLRSDLSPDPKGYNYKADLFGIPF